MRHERIALALLLMLMSQPLAQAAPPPKHIEFARGASSVTLDDAVARGEVRYYSFAARAGQTLKLELRSPESNAVAQVYRPGFKVVEEDGIATVQGKPLAGLEEGSDRSEWSGALPDAGAYLLVVGSTRGGSEYKLTLSITGH